LSEFEIIYLIKKSVPLDAVKDEEVEKLKQLAYAAATSSDRMGINPGYQINM